MIKKIDSGSMGRSRLGWLTSWFHFSFAEYYNPDNIHFGALRVINDDLIQPHTGFDTHPHSDMEIITYVIDGELTHGDSMSNTSTLKRGEVQYMSAGTGVFHSEKNEGGDPLRLLQIWILPDKAGYEPRYGEYRFPWEDRLDRWLPLVCGEAAANENGGAPIRIHQDMNLYAASLSPGSTLEFGVITGRQAYLVLAEGGAVLTQPYSPENETPAELSERGGAEITPGLLRVTASDEGAHVLLFDMPQVFTYA